MLKFVFNVSIAERKRENISYFVDFNSHPLDGFYKAPSSLLPDGVYKYITISRAAFEQKCGESV